jgi:hypothetical protein
MGKSMCSSLRCKGILEVLDNVAGNVSVCEKAVFPVRHEARDTPRRQITAQVIPPTRALLNTVLCRLKMQPVWKLHMGKHHQYPVYYMGILSVEAS